MARVDVVVPCYNYGRYLNACVHSVLSQAGVDVSVIIVDDASTDNTPDLCRKLSEDPRVSVIRHETNKGHIATYNDGLDQVTAEYVVLLSADDLLAPGALSRATGLMDEHPSVGFVYGHPVTFRGETPPSPRDRRPGRKIWSGADWVGLMCRTGQNFIYCPEVVMRTRVQRQIGSYRKELPHSGDMEMWLRAAMVSDVGRITGVDQAYYRLHPQSMQHTIYAGLLRDLYGRRAAFESALLAPPAPVEGAEHLLEVAKKALARAALKAVLESFRCGNKPGQPPEDFIAFAVETFPRITESRLWRLANDRRSPSAHPLLTRIESVRIDLRDRIQWQIWRRDGVQYPRLI